jgi:AcrR family transcriptional regulator
MTLPPIANAHQTTTSRVVVEGESSATAQRRKDAIVRAARDIIANEGIARFSLGRLEKQVEMARGHLTYYFPTKEDILLAVFDSMLAEMKERLPAEAAKRGGPPPMTGQMKKALPIALAMPNSDMPEHRAFLSLVWTFLAQMPHRPDFRDRIAEANASWRAMLAADYELSTPTGRTEDPVAVASILMALLTGLDGQLAVDPNAFDRHAVAKLAMRLLEPLFPNTDGAA